MMAVINKNLTVSGYLIMTLPLLKKTQVKRPLINSKNRTHFLAQQFGYSGLINPNNAQSLADRYINCQQLQHQQEQHNVEIIFKLAYDKCNNETTTEPDPDWLVRFIKMAKQVYSLSMQKLWARILKKELITPGSTSLKTLTILISMTHKETILFQRVIDVSCQINNSKDRKIITSIRTKAKFIDFRKKNKNHVIEYHQYGLPYSSITILMDLGLILKTEFESSKINYTTHLQLLHNMRHSLNCYNKNTSITYYRISPTGQELASLIEYKKNSEYQIYLLDLLSQMFTITTEQ
ncbi:TIGR03899 family protein [Photobacterium toruni]|uniref:TIGR03899 family protein n=1 Tax=Photobacterium toruni TaxID=1935446 RepID=UPI0021104D1F|nr:TIGR03899 family protein [Photobacterium toruni]